MIKTLIPYQLVCDKCSEQHIIFRSQSDIVGSEKFLGEWLSNYWSYQKSNEFLNQNNPFPLVCSKCKENGTL